MLMYVVCFVVGFVVGVKRQEIVNFIKAKLNK
jgi:hypothetical protein